MDSRHIFFGEHHSDKLQNLDSKNNAKNIVFMGTPQFARDILESICALSLHKILGVITQIDKPFGRKKILKSPEVKEYAVANNIPCFQPKKSSEIYGVLQSIESNFIESNFHKDSNISNNDTTKVTKIDIIIVVAYGKILQENVINNYFCINLHGSILPYFRGASPIQSSIINDYIHFGLSVIAMDLGLDSGDILESVPINAQIVADKDLNEVLKILVPYGVNALLSVISKLDSNTLTPQKQDSSLATYCAKFEKKDAFLDLDECKSCYLRYLALGYIGTWVYFQNEILKINSILGYDYSHNGVKGEIIEIKKDRILLACNSGALWIESVTPQNKGKMNITNFLQSKKLALGDMII